MVGRIIQIKRIDKFYRARVRTYSESHRPPYTVQYDDGVWEALELDKHHWFLDDKDTKQLPCQLLDQLKVWGPFK